MPTHPLNRFLLHPAPDPGGDAFVGTTRGAGRPGSTTPAAGDAGAAGSQSGRPWIGVEFTCSGQYVRVYRHVDGTKYMATCPECGRCTRFRVAPGGSNARMFQLSCR